MKTLILALFLSLSFPGPAFAHPGNTDASGCHTCRTNCSKWGLSTGEYHCHRAKALPQPKEPIRSHNNGTTELWPEYKNTVPVVTTPAAVQKTNPVSEQKTTPAQAIKVVPKITYALARGMENNQVLRLQQILAKDPSIYPEGQITGYFGPATERALKAFQRKNGLEPVGFTGPKTRVLLNR